MIRSAKLPRFKRHFTEVYTVQHRVNRYIYVRTATLFERRSERVFSPYIFAELPSNLLLKVC